MTSKKTIVEKSLTTIQLSKETVHRLRQAESYPRETYDCIIARIVQTHTAITAKLKGLELYPNEAVESIVTRLAEENNRGTSKEKLTAPIEKAEASDGKSDAASFFKKNSQKLPAANEKS